MEVQKGLFLLAAALITTATAANSIVNVTDLSISADNPVRYKFKLFLVCFVHMMLCTFKGFDGE